MLKRKRASSNLKEQYALANQEYEHTKCDLWIHGSLQETTSDVYNSIRQKVNVTLNQLITNDKLATLLKCNFFGISRY